MLKKLTIITALFAASFFFGCEEKIYVEEDFEAPAVPRGVESITGDEVVFLSWYPNDESDLAGYGVFRSFYENEGYELLATTQSPHYDDLDVLNGQTYFYAVTAYDFSDNESDLSYDLVFDTPRPEGAGARMYDQNRFADISAYDFSNYSIQDFRDGSSDICFEYHQTSGGLYINTLRQDTQIQDYGYTETFDDVSYAPEFGWSKLGFVEAILGHTYLIWTSDNHFAKIRITDLNSDLVQFDWGYQIDPGNPEVIAVKLEKPEQAK
ncbi:MAG: hypothetical protein DWQ05_19240 [Calditrichaeota bacterium]|nr:MAG: hypothetical protein DWQ05_19240 [Calditrichota bacterium]